MRIAAIALVGGLFAAALGACSASPTRGSIGAVLGRDPDSGAVFVRDVTERTGEPEPELLAGDEIVMVDGVHVRDLSTKELRHLLRGAAGTRVRLTVVRGGDVRRLEIERAPLREAISTGEERIDE